MGSRWIFTEDQAAIQVCNIVRLAIGRSGINGKPYAVLAHVISQPAPFTIATFDTREDAEDGIKDMVVGREHRRS